jgi:NAD+ synthase (glutamine-hydrolysing)
MTAIVGVPYVSSDLHNAAAVLHDGKLVDLYFKQYLPNYGVFDEDRYFQTGRESPIFALGDIRIGVSICEDIWYPDGPHQAQVAEGGAHLLINISSSPYEVQKSVLRERMICTRAAENAAFVAYCNLVGGQDELVFDGNSLICGPRGEIIARAPQFEEILLVADLDVGHLLARRLHDPRLRKASRTSADVGLEIKTIHLLTRDNRGAARSPVTPMIASSLERMAEIYAALALGTRDYVNKNGFSQVVIGLSGGVDSSLTAAIAAEAVGSKNTIGVSMPTRYSSEHSLVDARQLADNLGVDYRLIPIDVAFQAFLEMLAPQFEGTQAGIAEENLQSRIRGAVLMALSNKFGWLVLTTGNKSEIGVGYSTLYGDTAGGFAVLKDVPKMLVYELCRYINSREGLEIIPHNVLSKAPSAELKPNQKDSDSLPEYGVLDKVMRLYVEESMDVNAMAEDGFDRQLVERVVRLIDHSEYKRRQSPPGVKIMARAFGKDWRLPITNAYHPWR